MIIGYARVSTAEQNLNRQMDQLKASGCERIYKEKITGTKRERPELEKMLDHLRSGDTVIICELTRLSRSTKDLFQLVEQIEKKGANIKSLKETWLDTTTPQGKLMFTIFAGISQFERDLISQRTKEGLDSARARGRKGGRPPKNNSDIERAIKLYRSKDYSLKEIKEMTGISKTSLYRYLELHTSGTENEGRKEKVAQLDMWLQVENNSKFVRGKNKVRACIEEYLSFHYNLHKPVPESSNYTFEVPYIAADDLDKTVNDIIQEMNHEAELKNCFIEFDIQCHEFGLSWS